MKSLRLWQAAVQYSMPLPSLASSSPLNLSLYPSLPPLYTRLPLLQAQVREKKGFNGLAFKMQSWQIREMLEDTHVPVFLFTVQGEILKEEILLGEKTVCKAAMRVPMLSPASPQPSLCPFARTSWQCEHLSPVVVSALQESFPMVRGRISCKKSLSSGIRNPAPGGLDEQGQSSGSIMAPM